jgi:endo-1,4-beta-D-glucanase Y
MRKLVLLTGIICINASQLIGQSRPFPQNITYPNGFMPAGVTSTLAQSEFNRWKNAFVVDCGSTKRTTTEVSANTKVESIGWSTIIAAYQGDKTLFDGLFDFYKSKRTAKANNMMGWHVTCPGFIDEGSALDGDLDVAFGLILAYQQWGGTYLDDAKTILQIIKENMIADCIVGTQTIKVLKGGYADVAWGGCDLTDISYYTPAFFRVFAEVTGESVWSQLADDTYVILNAGANPATGLVPDWQKADGTPGPLGRTGTYAYDASRVPWRIAIDYLWNGNTNARDWCIKVTNWANGIGAANITDGYNLDGTTLRTLNNNSAFVGAFAVSAMCNNQTIANNFGTRMGQLNDTYWYNLNLRVVYLQVMTGNFWKPILTSIHETPGNASKIKIYPNPLNQNNLLTINGLKIANLLEVIDLNGKILIPSISVSSSIYTLDISSLNKGIYILKIIAENGEPQQIKFSKQ